MKVVLVLVFLLSILAFAGGNSGNALKLKGIEKVVARETRDGRDEKSQGKAEKNTKKGKHPKTVSKKNGRKTKKTDKGSKKHTNRQTDTCESGVTAQCMENAKDVLFFEAYQRNNFLKQFTRFGNQNRTSFNKLDKKGNFEAPKKHLEDTAGGNISAVSCDSNTTLAYFMANYTLLANCSALVNEKCNTSGPGPDVLAAMVKCNGEMEKTKTFTDECRLLTTDGAAQCDCWATAKRDNMDLIKALRPKCTEMQKIAQDMKKEKNDCLDAFTLCKKAEDAAVRLIADCMNYATQDLNQTHISNQAGAEITG